MVEKKLPWAYSPWLDNPRLKEAGKFMNSNIYKGIRGISWVMLIAAGLEAEEFERLICECRAI